MLLPIMVYLGLVAALLGLAGLVAERFCVALGLPRRGVWLATLVVSLLLPAAALLADREAPVPAAATPAGSDFDDAAIGAAWSEPADTSFALPDWSLLPAVADWLAVDRPSWAGLDASLTALWAISSAAVLLFYALTWHGLARAARRWPIVRIERSDVLISDRLGPAMFGLLSPRIVLPRWLLGAEPAERSLVLRHEQAHLSGRDQWFLLAGLLLTALAPWNPVLWWQLRRLRSAIELDCDARVVRGGADPLAYSRVLLAVRQRRAPMSVAAVALTEPAAALERRIRHVLRPPRINRPLAAGCAALSAAVLAAACALEPPVVDEAGSGSGATVTVGQNGDTAIGSGSRQPITAISMDGQRVVVLVDASASMLDSTLAGIESSRRQPVAVQRAAPKWLQTVDIVEELVAQIPVGSQFQIFAFNDNAHPLVPDTEGRWLSVTDDAVAGALRNLREALTPSGPSSLYAAFSAAEALRPAPDRVILLTDGLPTTGTAPETATTIDAERRLGYFEAALDVVPADAAVSILLLPMEGDAGAAPAYWSLALSTGGSLVAPPLLEQPPAGTGSIPGVVLDSRFLVFVVDTSGSMRQFAWDAVLAHMDATIDAYPSVEGIRVLSDEGELLVAGDGSEWIANVPERRQALADAMRGWMAFSNSSPREGILAAIDSLDVPDGEVAIYVYGDDFASGSANGSANELIATVTATNRSDEGGARKVRIHSVAFPVYHNATGGELLSAATYASLMREVSQRNGGVFVGLPADD